MTEQEYREIACSFHGHVWVASYEPVSVAAYLKDIPPECPSYSYFCLACGKKGY